MPEEPDGGQDAAGEPAVRDDEWEDLAPAVRRITEDEWASATSTDSTAAASDGGSSDADTVDSDDTAASDDTQNGADNTGDADTSEADDAVSAADDTDADGVEDADDADGDSEDSDEWEWSYDDFDSVGPSKLEQDLSDSEGDESSVGDSDVASIQAEDTDTTVIEADETPDPTTSIGGTAPDTDVEQPLAVHVEEMVKRLAIVIAIAALASVAVFPVTETLVGTIWNHVLPGGEAVDPRVYHPLELIITQLKVASLAGLVVALPVLVYQSYVFMKPGLYKQERRYYLAAVPTSLVLAVLGVLFSYFVVLPYTMDYFQGYTQGTADVAFALGTTFNLILMVMGYLAIVFQIPLFIMLAIMLGVVTRKWLESRRLLFWGAFAGISFAFGSIDPTGVVPVLVAITMIVLFEGTLLLLRWTGN
jgi:sec-independent protein translocase protein TatC